LFWRWRFFFILPKQAALLFRQEFKVPLLAQ